MPQKKRKTAAKEIQVSFIRRFQLSEKVCPVCDKTFMGTKKAKYDSQACRQKANYDRHATAYRKQKKERYRSQKKQAAKKKGK